MKSGTIDADTTFSSWCHFREDSHSADGPYLVSCSDVVGNHGLPTSSPLFGEYKVPLAAFLPQPADPVAYIAQGWTVYVIGFPEGLTAARSTHPSRARSPVMRGLAALTRCRPASGLPSVSWAWVSQASWFLRAEPAAAAPNPPLARKAANKVSQKLLLLWMCLLIRALTHSASDQLC